MTQVSGLVRIQVKFTLAGTILCSNTFHLVKLGTVDPDELDDITLAIATTGTGTLATAYINTLCATDTLDTITAATVTDPTTPDDPPGLHIRNVLVAGSRSTPSPTGPAELCPTVTLQTGYGSRRRRGRMFLPGPRDGAVLTGEVFNQSSSYWTAVAAINTALRTYINGAAGHPGGALADYGLAVYSEVGQLQDPPGTTQVLTTRLNTKSHWLRSRSA